MNKIVIMMGALSGLVFGSISDGMGWIAWLCTIGMMYLRLENEQTRIDLRAAYFHRSMTLCQRPSLLPVAGTTWLRNPASIR